MPDDEVYEVSHIIDEDYSNPNERVFLVRWLRYGPDYDSWEPLDNLLPGAKEIVNEWDRKKRPPHKRKAKEDKVYKPQKRFKREVSEFSDDPPKERSRRVRTPQADHKTEARVLVTTPNSRVVRQQSGINEFFLNTRKGPELKHYVQAGTPLYQPSKSNGTYLPSLKQTLVTNSANGSTLRGTLEEDESDMDVIAMDSPTVVRKRKEKHPPHLYTAFLSALDDISGPPVWVVNDVDSEPCPPLVFEWTEDYQFGPGVPPRDEHFSHGCTCPGDECDLRNPNACECLEYSDEKNFAYDVNGLIHHPPGGAIFECNDICGCGRSCPNRVVQRGRRMPLEIFKTEKKGWGVRACRPIPKGMFICRYAGEVITEAEAERRGKEYDKKGITYLFDLDFFRNSPDNASETGTPEAVENLYCVDAMHYGNVSRFLNHSCNPNVAIYTVVRHGDMRVYDLAIFSIKAIKPYEELCFDYKAKKGVEVKQQCFCGEKNCSGWLFGS